MASDGMGHEVPPLAEISRHDADGWVVAYVGISARTGRGLITHSDTTNSVISFDATGVEDVVRHDYMGHLRELPASADIPLADVRNAAHEFVDANGARPTCISRQPAA